MTTTLNGQTGVAATAHEVADALAAKGVKYAAISFVDVHGKPKSKMVPLGHLTQAALGSDLALVFDECTPFHADRDYTAHSTERTHRWLARCLDWHAAHGPEHQLVYGIVQGGVYEDLRRESTEAVSASACDGIAIGGSLGADKDQIYEVVGWCTGRSPGFSPLRMRPA